MNNMAEVLFESKEKNPLGVPFITVKRSRGYFIYTERGGVDSVFFVLYNRETCKFALINESKPPMDEAKDTEVSMTTAFGGSIDCDLSFKEIVQTEVVEEAGYVVPLENIFNLGRTMVSTQMSQLAHGYLVDVTTISKTAQTEYENDGKGNRTSWMTMGELIENSDWKSMFILLKAQAKGLL